jgi:predicted phosphodiesterase
MATRLLLLADTHVPKRARDLPEQVWEAVDSADLVVHAGDWVDVSLLDALESRARRLVGVAGNNDHGVLRERLPEVARVDVEGLRLGVVHETGPATGREARCDAAHPVSTCSSSGTATSRGTRPPRAACGCSTPAPPPTDAGSRTART